MDKVGEVLVWTNGPVGMLWTNSLAGQSYQTIRIDSTNDLVSVPVGSFTNCFRYHSTVYGGSNTTEWDWWVKPGYGMIQYTGQLSNSPALFRHLGNF